MQKAREEPLSGGRLPDPESWHPAPWSRIPQPLPSLCTFLPQSTAQCAAHHQLLAKKGEGEETRLGFSNCRGLKIPASSKTRACSPHEARWPGEAFASKGHPCAYPPSSSNSHGEIEPQAPSKPPNSQQGMMLGAHQRGTGQAGDPLLPTLCVSETPPFAAGGKPHLCPSCAF